MNSYIKYSILFLVLFIIQPYVAFCQNEETKADTEKLTMLISRQTGIPTVAAVIPENGKYDIKIQFMGDITNYQGVMGVVIGGSGAINKRVSLPNRMVLHND